MIFHFDLAVLRLRQAIEMDRHDFFRTQKFHDAADLFRLSGRQNIADLCDRATERFWGDDTELQEILKC